MEVDKNRRKILTLHDMTSDIEARLHDFVTAEFSMIREKIAELQKVIDDFQDMEDKVTLAILNREGNVESSRDVKIVEK